VVADVGHLLAASIAGPWPPDPGEEEGLLVGALESAPHHGALRRVLVGLGEGCRRNDATMLAVQPVAPQVVLQAPKVGPVTGAWLGTVGNPKELPLHRLSVSSLVQFVDEVRLGYAELLTGFDYLGVALGHRRIEGRDMGPNRASGLLDAIQRVAPLIRERRDEFDKLRRLPDDIFETLAAAGLFRLWLPRRSAGPSSLHSSS
jgi:hypothetical protein